MMKQMMISMMANKGCKWCQVGECWDHNPFAKGKGRERAGPYKAAVTNVEPAMEAEVSGFLEMHQVETHAAQKLANLDPKLQTLVINQLGGMEDARDKTAVLITKISQVKNMKQGDWICPGCMDIQFAKNTACRKCSTARPEASTLSTPTLDVAAASPEDVEAFLSLHDFQEHAVAKLISLDPRLQTVVINQGSMDDARDKTAVLISRCSQISSMKEGDWICPGCMDLQFARNTSCRKCLAPKP